MVEGPTAKAYAIKISQKFEGETVNDIIVKSKRVFIEPKELLYKRFNGSDALGKNIILFFRRFCSKSAFDDVWKHTRLRIR